MRCLNLSRNLVYIGLSDIDPPEQSTIDKLAIKHTMANACFKEDIPLKFAFKQPSWISLDVDVLDATEFASTGCYTQDGVSKEFLIALLKANKEYAIGYDLAEVNFALHKGDDQTNTSRDI